MNEFAGVQWQRAIDTLNTGRQIIEIDPDSAASRAYYAAFHALTALFALQEKSFSKHSALRSALHRDLIRKGQLSVEVGKAFDFLMDMRETGDYGGLIRVSREDARKSVEKAEMIIEAVSRYCPNLPKSNP